MDSTSRPLAVELAIHLDGRFVRSVSLSAEEVARALAAGDPPVAAPADCRTGVAVGLPQAGRVTVNLDLRSAAPADASLLLRQVTSYTYDAAALAVRPVGTRTTYTYGGRAPDPPADEPHIVG